MKPEEIQDLFDLDDEAYRDAKLYEDAAEYFVLKNAPFIPYDAFCDSDSYDFWEDTTFNN